MDFKSKLNADIIVESNGEIFVYLSGTEHMITLLKKVVKDLGLSSEVEFKMGAAYIPEKYAPRVLKEFLSQWLEFSTQVRMRVENMTNLLRAYNSVVHILGDKKS